jgi:adenylate cyclase, class 2
VPLEIELKVRLGDPAPVIRRLVAMAGEPIGDVVETNTFYDARDGRLRAADCGLRIRWTRKTTEGQPQPGAITYKGPRLPGPLKKREEIELALQDPADAAALLRKLGFVEQLMFEKRRQTWHLGGCEVVLDELPELGHFLEIEGPGEQAIEQVRGLLGLAELPAISEGYAEIVATHLLRRGSRRLSFSGNA